MNFLQSLTTPIFAGGYKTSLAKCDYCERALTVKNPAAQKAGIRMHGHWYCSSRCFTGAAERELAMLLRSRYYRNDPKPRMPLGLSMVSRGLLGEEDFRHAAKRRKLTGREIGDLLIEDGVLTEAQLTAARAAQWGCPVFDVPEFPAPAVVQIPQTLIDANGAVPLHFVQATRTLLMGFDHAIEYAFLYAVETVTGCKTQACFVTPSGFRTRTEQRRWLLDSGHDARPMEVKIDHARSVTDMARALCKFSVEFEADEAVIGQCKDYVWARLKSPGKEVDLLFAA